MSVDIDSVLSDFEDVNPTMGAASSPQIKVDGDHKIQVVEVRGRESQRDIGFLYLIEYEVLETSAPESVKVGNTYSARPIDLLDKRYGKSNALQFIGACTGLDVWTEEGEEAVKEAAKGGAIQESWGPDQPLAGSVLRLITQKRTSEKGYEYMKNTFKVIDSSDD